MNRAPRDVTDLYLAPVALEIDRRLDALAGLSVEDLDFQVALQTDRQPTEPGSRATLLLATLSHLMPMHGWELSWDPRGVRLRHEGHSLVLGAPDSVRTYVISGAG
jgi:hypothetical protein